MAWLDRAHTQPQGGYFSNQPSHSLTSASRSRSNV